jgi:hypothetical protein
LKLNTRVCALKTGFLAQRALRRKPGVSADYLGFLSMPKKINNRRKRKKNKELPKVKEGLAG